MVSAEGDSEVDVVGEDQKMLRYLMATYLFATPHLQVRLRVSIVFLRLLVSIPREVEVVDVVDSEVMEVAAVVVGLRHVAEEVFHRYSKAE